jgi:hypothetical protein
MFFEVDILPGINAGEDVKYRKTQWRKKYRFLGLATKRW